MLTTAWIPFFFLCRFDWKTGTLLVRNASFHCSRTVQLVPTFSHVPSCIFRTIARAHCMAHRHTRLGQHGVTSRYVYTVARLNGRAWFGWKKRILLGGQIAVAFVRSRCKVMYISYSMGWSRTSRGLDWFSVGCGGIVWKIINIQSVYYIIYIG